MASYTLVHHPSVSTVKGKVEKVTHIHLPAFRLFFTAGQFKEDSATIYISRDELMKMAEQIEALLSPSEEDQQAAAYAVLGEPDPAEPVRTFG